MGAPALPLRGLCAHPAEFVQLTGLRVAQFWLGPIDDLPVALGISVLTLLSAVGAWRAWPRLSVPQRAALLIPLATFPLVYYTVVYMANYPVPVAWILLILGGAEVRGWFARQE